MSYYALRKESLVLIVILMYLVGLTYFVSRCYRVNDGHLAYALDDAYIHMAMAKNISEHGNFGVSQYEFSNSSSSPLWTLLLGGVYRVTGVSEWTPLILNALFGGTALVVAWSLGVRAKLSRPLLFLLLIGIVLLTPFVPLAISGMEHLLQILAVLFWMLCVWAALESGVVTPWRENLALALSTMIAVSTRYETLFLIAPTMVVMVAQRRWKTSFFLGLAAAVPVVAFGAFAVVHGGSWLPNSILLKGTVPSLDVGWLGSVLSVGKKLVLNLVHNPHINVLIISVLLLFAWRRHSRRPIGTWDWLVLVVVVATGLHLQFARVGWFYRYEAYLVAAMMLLIGLELGDLWNRRSEPVPSLLVWLPLSMAMLLILFAPIYRAAEAHTYLVAATQNVYQQQYQMGKFLHRYYDKDAVALNDIGAATYFSDIRCVDLWGLACQEVARHRRNATFSTSTIRELIQARKVRLAILYQSWFQGQQAAPGEWQLVGTWTMPSKNIVCGSPTISFFAVNPTEAEWLRKNLRAFSSQLPEGVIWHEQSETDRS